MNFRDRLFAKINRVLDERDAAFEAAFRSICLSAPMPPPPRIYETPIAHAPDAEGPNAMTTADELAPPTSIEPWDVRLWCLRCKERERVSVSSLVVDGTMDTCYGRAPAKPINRLCVSCGRWARHFVDLTIDDRWWNATFRSR